MPRRRASTVLIHTGFVFVSSLNHFEFADRVWINVGRRKVETRTISPASRSSSASSM